MHERIVCSACSKHSGLNDLIYSALNVSFMVAFYMPDISLNRPTEVVPLTGSTALVMAQSKMVASAVTALISCLRKCLRCETPTI
jgi:hypothetical protein